MKNTKFQRLRPMKDQLLYKMTKKRFQLVTKQRQQFLLIHYKMSPRPPFAVLTTQMIKTSSALLDGRCSKNEYIIRN